MNTKASFLLEKLKKRFKQKYILVSLFDGISGTSQGLKRNKGKEVHKLTVNECERLQGFPIGYTTSVSKSRALKALGNSFNIPTIERFFYSLSTKRGLV